MAFRPGELDQYIKVQEQQEAADGYGGNALTWVDKGEIFAHVRPLSGREVTEFERVNAEARYLFVVRYPADITESDRIIWEDEEYNIRVLKKPKGRDLYMQIEAERGVAQ